MPDNDARLPLLRLIEERLLRRLLFFLDEPPPPPELPEEVEEAQDKEEPSSSRARLKREVSLPPWREQSGETGATFDFQYDYFF